MQNKKTVQLRLKIAINKTRQQIFDAATDWEKQSDWVYLTKVSAVDSSPNRVGKELQAFTGLLGIGFLDTMTIEEWDYPNKCTVVHTGNVVKGKGIFETARINNNNYFIWTEEVILPLGVLGKVGWVFVKPVSALGLWVSLRRFRRFTLDSSK
jgi:hypothetical protein